MSIGSRAELRGAGRLPRTAKHCKAQEKRDRVESREPTQRFSLIKALCELLTGLRVPSPALLWAAIREKWGPIGKHFM